MDWFLLIILIGINMFMISSAKTMMKKLDNITLRQKRMFTKILQMDTNQRLIQEILVELRKEVSDIRDPLKPQAFVTFTIGPVTEQN